MIFFPMTMNLSEISHSLRSVSISVHSKNFYFFPLERYGPEKKITSVSGDLELAPDHGSKS